MARLLDKILGFAASVRLAVVVILGLAVYLAIGTAYEARYGARAAGEIVYQSPVFICILALLAVNVLAAAVIRFPWKRHQTGFVITHAGILVLLAGCLIGQRWGVDGRMVLRSPGEGETDRVTRENAIDLPAEQLAIFDAQDRAIAVFPIDLRRASGFPPPLRLLLHPVWPVPPIAGAVDHRLGAFEGVDVRATAWHPAVRVEPDGSVRPIRVRPEDLDSSIAAVRVRLGAMGRSREVWVVRGERPVEVDTPGGTIKLGYGFAASILPFEIELLEARRGVEGVSATIGIMGRRFEIAPNRPATVQGMTVYLGSIEPVDGRVAAFLSVRRDPGWVVKYLGCGLIVLGTVLMFVIRRSPREAPPPVEATVRGRRERRRRLAGAPVAAAVLMASVATTARAELDMRTVRAVPVEYDGRVMPLDSLAREVVRAISGRSGDGALRTFIEWSSDPRNASGEAVVSVPLIELRRKIGLAAGESRVSRNAVQSNAEIEQWISDTVDRASEAESRSEDPALDRLEQSAVDLFNRLVVLDAVLSGRIARLKHPGGSTVLSDVPQWRELLSAARAGEQGRFDDAARALLAVSDGAVADRMRREVSYNLSHPFRWVGLTYGMALVVLLASMGGRWPGSRYAGEILLCVAIVSHTSAFVWRCAITGWAPVTNMYETVVWVGGVSAGLGLAMSLLSGARVAAVAGAVVAVFACVVGDVMPPEYGRSIRNLAPVLQSNLWLTVHVLTVVSSYAAFAVALVLGNVALWQMSNRGLRSSERGSTGSDGSASGRHPKFEIRNLALIYRCIQIGVVLIAAGTVLGGVWADYSWGRFWGWDPKEVWALIVLLAYLALLHGRYVGWVGEFGLAAGAVLCFLTVLMSWYGVNFVLGSGLHSYGFGAGGLEYVLVYVAIQLMFVAWAWWRYRSLPQSEERGPNRMNEKGEVVAATD